VTRPTPNDASGRYCATAVWPVTDSAGSIRSAITSFDFVCTKHRLIVEADGGQHAENQADESRTKVLVEEGWRIIRFWNNDVLANADGVVETILRALEEK
jgi:very-short-patch-repair endonuclease